MLKTVLVSIGLTAAAMLLTFKFFMASILGSVGLAVTSVEALAAMKASQSLVQSLKTRHQVKKTGLRKNFVKKTSKKVLASSIAAITVGTVAVALTTTTLEVMGYCERQKELHEDENLLYGLEEPYNLDLCIENADKDAKAILDEFKAQGHALLSEGFG